MAVVENIIEFVHVIILLAALLFSATLLAEIFLRIKMPIVLGELLEGIIIGPIAIGGLILFDDKSLVALNKTIRALLVKLLNVILRIIP